MAISRRIIGTFVAFLALVTVAWALSSSPASATHPRMHVYKGQATITSVDAENDIITVNFDSANRALRNALDNNLDDVQVHIGPDTEFSLDGNDPVDVSDLCSSGDTVTIVIKTTDRLSGHDFSDYPADKVIAMSPEGGCTD
jgi:hypothetical protein